MLKKLWQHKWWLAVAAGISVFLAFPCFYLVPTILFFPLLTIRSAELCKTFKQAFWVGFLTSFMIMLGGFYWVTYVIHEFGYLPWPIAGLVFLGFSGYGALNFPIFTTLVFAIEKTAKVSRLPPLRRDLWLVFGYPALFTLIEYTFPKLFPWYLGHCLYQAVWLTQIVEFTGSVFLTFAVMSLGGLVYAAFETVLASNSLAKRWVLTFPIALWVFMAGISIQQLRKPIEGHPLRVALIQANIGSLEKVAARSGFENKMRLTLDTHIRLTDQAMQASPRPDLILWPETAMPFQMEYEGGKYAGEVRQHVKRWGVPLITGGYGSNPLNFYGDYNTAFLLEPLPDGTLRLERYHKNILLAFGEYMPFGEWFPILYKKFPQVSNFERGRTQDPFVLRDGTRLGVTICYEAIVPSFFRKTASHDVNLMVNLTNDSWFGPTAEPYLHGSLTVFRAIETRKPLVRVTNTGTSFTVDRNGRQSTLTRVYGEDTLINDLQYGETGELTWYVRYGDWFVVLLLLAFTAFAMIELRKKHVPLSR